jgi:hypothetical protein
VTDQRLETFVVFSWLKSQFMLQYDSKSHDQVQAAHFAKQILLFQFSINTVLLPYAYAYQTRQSMQCGPDMSPESLTLELPVHVGRAADAHCEADEA